MTKHPDFHGLTLRSGVVESPGVGWILAADRALAERERPHAAIFHLQGGTFRRLDVDFSAHSCCLIIEPEPGFVAISTTGRYLVETARGVVQGNIYEDSSPAPTRPLYGDFRRVTEIGGKAHAVGHEGMVYRLDSLNAWTRIDEGLPASFNAEVAQGYGLSDIYAAGFRGQLWHFGGANWRQVELPTNSILAAILCIPNSVTYIGGHRGVLLRGLGDSWALVENDDIDDIWGLAWFAEELYVSTLDGLYRFRDSMLVPIAVVDDDAPASTYQLSVALGVLWSIGENDLFAFDGSAWTRVV
jgi:hypothetical protein